MERRRPHCGIQIPNRYINGRKLVDIRCVPSPTQPRFFGLYELVLSVSVDNPRVRNSYSSPRVLMRGTHRQCWDWAWEHGYFVWGVC